MDLGNLKVDENELLKNYVQEIKNDDFKALVTKLGLTEEVAMKYTSKLRRTCNELANCKKCKGIMECKNQVNGFVYYPTVNKDLVRFDYIACNHEQKKLKSEAASSKFFSEPIQIKNAKMADIDLTDKKRAEIIKWIKYFYKEYQNDKHIKGVYLHGSFGCGKSYLLAALLNELASKGNKCIIAYFPELLRTLKENFSDEFKNIMNELKNADILLIDDIGAESVSEWSRDEILGTILQYRMDSKLPTFLTSNLNIEELESHLSVTKTSVNITKSKRIIERIKQLTEDIELISENRRY